VTKSNHNNHICHKSRWSVINYATEVWVTCQQLKRSNSPSLPARFHFVSQLYVLGVNVKLPLPLAKNAGEYGSRVNAHTHINRWVGLLLHIPANTQHGQVSEWVGGWFASSAGKYAWGKAFSKERAWLSAIIINWTNVDLASPHALRLSTSFPHFPQGATWLSPARYSLDGLHHGESHVHAHDGVIRSLIGGTANAIIAIAKNLNAQLLIFLGARQMWFSSSQARSTVKIILIKRLN